jgi:hypothetical protein
MEKTRISSGISKDCGYNDRMAGKPKADRAQVKANTLRIRMTESERAELDAAASSQKEETSTWAREELLILARKLPKRKR